jgi:hexosaminidase
MVGRGSSETDSVEHAGSLGSLQVSLLNHGATSSISEEAILPLGTRDEEYTLTIPTNGSAATLFANSTLGLYRGLTTFSQLWYYNTQSQTTYISEAPIHIVDSPAYVSIHAQLLCINVW